MDNLIVTEKNNHILTITLNRFDKKNALTSSMYRTLATALTDANTADDIRCVVIQGDENCFCAGNDLKDFLEHSEELAALEFIDALVLFKKPLNRCCCWPCRRYRHNITTPLRYGLRC